MRDVLLAAIVGLASFVVVLPVHAAGEVFAVLPTQSNGGVTSEAEMAGNLMRLALQEQSIALVPSKAVNDAVFLHDTACQQSLLACARLVAQDVGATKVIISELWDQAGILDLRIALVDARAGTEPAWQSHRAHAASELGPVAQRAVLGLVVPEVFSGVVRVQMEAGAEILVNGVARDRTPMLTDLRLPVGRHEIEVRFGKLKPWKSWVEVAMEKPIELSLCAVGDDVTDRCGESSVSPMVITGAVLTGVGAVAVGTAFVTGLFAADAASKWNAGNPHLASDARTAQLLGAVAVSSAIAGVVLIGAGVGVLAMGLAE